MKTTLKLGKANYYGERLDSELDIKLRDTKHGPELSVRGGIWDKRHRDYVTCGQCIDEIAKMHPGNATVARIHAIWKDWHLNSMNAGTPEQEAEIERRKRENPDDLKNAPYNGDHYAFCVGVLKTANLYEVPLTPDMRCTGNFPADVLNGSRGYQYGERWLYRPIPADVLAEIHSWFNVATVAAL